MTTVSVLVKKWWQTPWQKQAEGLRNNPEAHAEFLARRINAFWRKRDLTAGAHVKPLSLARSANDDHTMLYPCVRSFMKNGKPVS